MIYYLVQGTSEQYPLRIAEMQDSGAEVIFLTWDKPVEGALFLPKSTNFQGRDFLLHHVLKNNYNFEYLVFIDGDAKPIKGSWYYFNKFLLASKPQICLPLMQCNKNLLYRLIEKCNLPLPIPTHQRALLVDMQTLSFRADVINAIGKIMHPTIFDLISWPYNGAIHLAILRYLIPYNIVQFNRLELNNNSSENYPKQFNERYIANYINKLGLGSLLPFFENKITFSRLRKFLSSFIELFYLIPFPIKEFDAAKRGEYVKQCLQKMKNIDMPKSKKIEDCINT